MTTEGKTVLITGSNRGIGQVLVDEALRRGARRVNAGSREPSVAKGLEHEYAAFVQPS